MKSCVVLYCFIGAAVAVYINPSCLRPCPMNYMPLCGSDGKTYANECEMKVASCSANAEITVASSGPCPVTKRATQCLTICPMIYFPVCGSDGKTYGNTCEMKVASCMTKTTVTLVKQGACDTSSSNYPGIILPN